MNARILFMILGVLLSTVVAAADEEAFREARQRMVEQAIATRNVDDEAVLEAMRRVPRHEFVREGDRDRAYTDRPIPIGYGQTISQPYIVAFMTAMIEPEPSDRVLEVGTGSGYQAAVLAETVGEVFTIEIIDELAQWGRGNLRESGHDEVELRNADGYYGWQEHAPYDAIVVTAAANAIPPPLVEQLDADGRMVIPVGSPFRTQRLMLVEKEGEEVVTESLMPVRFVPLTREDEQ